MNIHFQDWTDERLLDSLNERDIPHGGRIIKVCATDEDPRDLTGYADLVVVDGESAPFTDEETYPYADRETYKGAALEAHLIAIALGDLGSRSVRTLFRFSNQQGFSQAAMAARLGEAWLIEHPFHCIDGIEAALRQPGRERAIHLDIFFAASLRCLKGIVDYDDPKKVLSMQDGMRLLGR